MDKKEELKLLYQLYLTNQCSSAELERFFSLIRENQDDDELIGLLSATWDRTEAIPETGLIPPFLPEKEITQSKPMLTRRISYSLRQFAAAAAILLVLGGAYLYRAQISQIVNPVQQLETFSKNAERKQFILADGTRVWLSPNSKLTYPDRFNDDKRIVSLDGEAFFEVTHDAARPFIIQSEQISTTVLGTSFNVSAYKDQQEINVTLVTGKVAVALKSSVPVIITSNQRITIDKSSEKITKTDFPDAEDFLNRRLGLFDYKGIPFRNVITDLESQYHSKISLSPDLDPGKFYGQLDMTVPIEQCLNKLSTVMEVSWKKEGGQYVIVR
ncbi:ferric-dicitrate binding protein FerR (iron transport regulator) [Pedobacter cryoconitis]|uniref:Ferric-dicitrate binding protein FerR (Iron transport regulator) n=1 Tax=Pedobacter cryoconitis TaxID=188932 RepID=A0A7W9DYM7_9SPHI|nr:FecR family protein [Pedobacter cryoconitis]MBB5636397.1 ferric-dicitrate binding protein FerR (iron transport regulator) [Pedobacter cryoconitis]